MKTKDKIIHTSLQLFNERGERQITTNHIAAELGISPGNLYYHFGNKQEIIRSIFQLYVEQLENSFRPHADQLLSLDHLTQYLDASFELMWRFRFMYANLLELLARDPELETQYQNMQLELSNWSRDILLQLKESRFINGDDATMAELADSVKFIIGAWIGYQSAQLKGGEITKPRLYQGVLKILFTLRPYFTEESMSIYQRLYDHYVKCAERSE
ncbi:MULTISPECIES: TetR/AcrR family transcriptional regulator [unclassified Agarivorans]|uniref:TetR/AcrR family transcriptional regulator n=1 Tax=unclassified Agarivorans TaxID=2636026 RepID=UPI0026E2D936|nr:MULTISPECIES: TetR/AcrR family transcriptional regulator [unclassified Agarivorans]MDO6685722.1 TetR/AcrR family transcriptional regulator [Agarivorans sp. 3_MG-2023]MDO6716163.1 TetR/AcrR family transcriptional regulator [Agarivorans sp. 2_MG-2023]